MLGAIAVLIVAVLKLIETSVFKIPESVEKWRPDVTPFSIEKLGDFDSVPFHQWHRILASKWIQQKSLTKRLER